MRKVNLKEFKTQDELITETDDQGHVTKRERLTLKYANLIKQVLNTAPQGGFSPIEIKVRHDIITLIDNAVTEGQDYVVMDDAQLDRIVELTKSHSFAFLDIGFVDFLESLEADRKEEYTPPKEG